MASEISEGADKRSDHGPAALVGTTVAHYRILDLVGAGSMGVVYRAEDLSLRRTVALKVVAPHRLLDAKVQELFLREARASAALEHPNVCAIYEVGQDRGGAFIAMAFLEGKTGRELLVGGPLAIDFAAHIVEKAARGLEAAHRRGIVHRDMKPDNIMVCCSGEFEEPRVCLVDFGVARLADQPDVTASGSVLGTISYMSPEQIADGEVDARSDVWSLGVVLYELLAGRKPFARGNASAVVYAIQQDDPEPIRTVRPEVTAGLQAVVARALEKQPRKRFGSAREMADALSAEVQAIRDSASGAPRAPVSQRRPWGWIAGAAACAIFAAAVFLLSRTPKERPAIWSPVSLTSSPGAEREPAFSQDGNRIAFSRSSGSGGDDLAGIFVRSLVTGEESRVTAVAGRDQQPAWSPDGRSIAFVRSEGEGWRIMVVPSEGGKPQAYGEPLTGSADLAWSPDSQSLLFTRSAPDGTSAIWSLRLASGETSQATHPPAQILGDRFPSYSPDGKTLAFARVDAGGGSIELTDGSGVRSVRAGGAGGFLGLTWTADGRALLFARAVRPEQAPLLWQVSASGTSPAEPLGGGALAGSRPTVSAARGLLAFQREYSDSDIYEGAIGAGTELELTPKIQSSAADSSPRRSPDGAQIAFVSSRSGWPEIWVASAGGAGNRQLSRLESGAGSPAWSPDGKWIAFDGAGPQEREIFVADVSTGRTHLLAGGPGGAILPYWSRDGEWIYFTSNRSGAYEIWKVGAAGGVPTQVTEGGGFAAQESADGKRLYFSRGPMRPGLFSMLTGGGPVETVAAQYMAPGMAFWSVGKAGQYFLEQGRSAQQPPGRPLTEWAIRLWSEQSPGTETIATIGQAVPAGMGALDIAADGAVLISVRHVDEADVLMVEGFR